MPRSSGSHQVQVSWNDTADTHLYLDSATKPTKWNKWNRIVLKVRYGEHAHPALALAISLTYSHGNGKRNKRIANIERKEVKKENQRRSLGNRLVLIVSSLLLLKLKISVQLRLDINNSVEQLGDNLVAVSIERLVELLKLLLGFLVYGGLRAGGRSFVL